MLALVRDKRSRWYVMLALVRDTRSRWYSAGAASPTGDGEMATQFERIIRRVTQSMSYRGCYTTRDFWTRSLQADLRDDDLVVGRTTAGAISRMWTSAGEAKARALVALGRRCQSSRIRQPFTSYLTIYQEGIQS
jgi:hypothetical protein